MVIELLGQEARQVRPVPEGREGAGGDVADLAPVLVDTIDLR